MSRAIEDVVAERHRQISEEGWTLRHDDDHVEGQLARAGGTYALHASLMLEGCPTGFEQGMNAPTPWPWSKDWWKPKTPRKDLVRAAALLIAEIERLDRAGVE